MLLRSGFSNSGGLIFKEVFEKKRAGENYIEGIWREKRCCLGGIESW
jgi:hypothetical protein